LVVTGSQFHQRDAKEPGEARVCIQNTGTQSLSMDRLSIHVLAQRAADSVEPAPEFPCVYARLSPPILPPGGRGEIVAKLQTLPPTADHQLTCSVATTDGAVSLMVPLAESAIWICSVGFAADLRTVFVYVENRGSEPAQVELLTVGDSDVAGRTKTVQAVVPPQDKGCLIASLPSPLVTGQFVPIVVAGDNGGRELQTQTVARAIPSVPIVMEFDAGDPGLGLDVERPFVQTMACPAHAHGRPEEASAKFLQGYTQQFSDNPARPIQMAVCRSDFPWAWFRFGSLPDAAAMNTCLRPPPGWDEDSCKWFCPFFRVGALAKRATEPGRFVAIIPTGPDTDEGAFLLKGLTSQEWRFLVYCAVSRGAKGVIYRGLPADDPLSRDAFRQLNRELQHLTPFLLMAEPVDWTTTGANDYAAESLLCGDQAVLIAVFDRRYFGREKNGRFYTAAFPRTASPVPISVRIPESMAVRDVRTPFAPLDPGSWDCRDGTLHFTACMVDSAQVFIASLQTQSPSPEEGGSQ
jgi:hypothetical protein